MHLLLVKSRKLSAAYNGNSISYDNIGNRTSYNGYTYTWENGRQLAGISGNGNNITYKYNSDGIRTQKTVNGTTTYYTLEGNNVVKQTTGNEVLWFYYDATGNVIGFEYLPTTSANSIAYFYVKNLQGDIIAISDVHGNIAAKYVYDSWGKIVTCLDCDGRADVNISALNPYRYRGYRYDTETGLYYLNSRYYDPEMKRFINADAFTSTGQGILGNNMFAYCQNNPILYIDETGSFIGLGIVGTLLLGAAIGGVIGAAYGAATAVATGQNVLASVTIGALEGGFLGLAAAATPFVGPVVAVGTGVLAGAGFDMINQGTNYLLGDQSKKFSLDWVSVGSSAAYAGVGVYLGAKFDVMAGPSYSSISDQVITSIIGGGFVTGVVGAFDFCTTCYISNSNTKSNIPVSTPTTSTRPSYGLPRGVKYACMY